MPTDSAISITLNGERASVDAGASIVTTLASRGLNPEQPGIAVAVNGRVIRRALWRETVLGEGDEVEVITAFQGG
jgi:sulfur carrier protein